MRASLLAASMVVAVVVAPAPRLSAQTVGDVFRRVQPSVVVIRATGRDATTGGGAQVVKEVGSGVLISSDGNVMTAAHVVQAMDEIRVELPGGETVGARVVASEPAADLSLLKLERVPPKAVVARLANSDAVRVGDQVIVVGAPYGLVYYELRRLGPGATLTVTILRAGQIKDLSGRMSR